MSQFQKIIQTPIGDLYIVASEAGIQMIYWDRQKVPMQDTAVLLKASRQLQEYFRGERKVFDLPLDIQGTEFQKRVWRQLQLIPYGETCSYKDIARKLNDNNASRAVGTANGKNPVSIVIPCHRVIASDGSLGGYSGGLDIKQKLLGLENSLTQTSLPI
jgi:methylated-DNA-[protein]-cysteine S-methyltransferase